MKTIGYVCIREGCKLEFDTWLHEGVVVLELGETRIAKLIVIVIVSNAYPCLSRVHLQFGKFTITTLWVPEEDISVKMSLLLTKAYRQTMLLITFSTDALPLVQLLY